MKNYINHQFIFLLLFLIFPIPWNDFNYLKKKKKVVALNLECFHQCFFVLSGFFCCCCSVDLHCSVLAKISDCTRLCIIYKLVLGLRDILVGTDQSFLFIKCFSHLDRMWIHWEISSIFFFLSFFCLIITINTIRLNISKRLKSSSIIKFSTISFSSIFLSSSFFSTSGRASWHVARPCSVKKYQFSKWMFSYSFHVQCFQGVASNRDKW